MRDWAKEVSQVLFECAKAPSNDAVKPFPWKPFSEALRQTFGLESFSIELASMQWAEPGEFLKGMGRKPRMQPIHFSPLKGAAHWILSINEVRSLMGWLVANEDKPLKLPEAEVEEAFFDFLCLEALHTLDKLSFFKKVTPSLGGEEPLPKEAGLLLDLTVKIGDHRIAMRIIASPELYRDWTSTFAAASGELAMPDELAERIHANIHLEIGKTRLHMHEWGQVNKGDCLLLDECQWTPGSGPYPVTLTVEGKPILNATLQNGQLKILSTIEVEKV